jgi:flagellar hook-associated protein 1 FlgK
MGSLLTALRNSADALGVYGKALDVVSNNVTNASTPGYAKQTAVLGSRSFDIFTGAPGGVFVTGVASSRNVYAEHYVQSEQTSLGVAQQKAGDLGQLATNFDATGKSGVEPAINSLFSGFSQLSVNPNDPATRQNVLAQAGAVAQQFQATAKALSDASSQESLQSQASIQQINSLAGTIAQLNADSTDLSGGTNAGIDAQLNSNLEELSKYVNFSSLKQPDGTLSVYVGGSPLVFGTHTSPLRGDFSTPQARVLNSQGLDITSQITGGQLAGTLQVQNSNIPAYQSDLNTLAQNLADQVNTTLGNGVDQNGAAPVNSLFTYNATLGAAGTLAVNPALTTDQIAAALPGAPGGNGNALALSGLATAKNVNGQTFSAYFGNLASKVGQDLSDAQTQQSSQSQVLTQAQTLRQQDSGVSLDTEAENLIEFQRAYQATSKLVSVLNTLTESTLNLIPG